MPPDKPKRTFTPAQVILIAAVAPLVVLGTVAILGAVLGVGVLIFRTVAGL